MYLYCAGGPRSGPEAPLTQLMVVSNGLSVFVCKAIPREPPKGISIHTITFGCPAGKHLSRVGFLGIPKSQRVFDFTVPGSVSRIRKFYDFSRFSQKVPSRSRRRVLWFCVFSGIKNKWLFSRIRQKVCGSVPISGLLRGPPALPLPAGPI